MQPTYGRSRARCAPCSSLVANGRQGGGLFTLKNTTSVNTDLAIRIRDVISIAGQATGFDKLAAMIHCRDRGARCQGDNLVALSLQEYVWQDEQCSGPHLE